MEWSSVYRNGKGDWIFSFRNDHKIILLTGRRESYEKETLAWLDKNNVFFDKLLFRGKDDFRPDEIVKQEIYENHIRGFFEVLFVVDDRSSVVKMWRSIGLLCLQCDDGNF